MYSLISSVRESLSSYFFFFNDTATTEIYTLSLHDALPIYVPGARNGRRRQPGPESGDQNLDDRYGATGDEHRLGTVRDRKSTRLNSSHLVISYAVFCLKKKKRVAHRLV